MAIYTETIDTSFNYSHIDIYKRYKDGVHCAYKAYPQEGYVMYSQSNDVFTGYDPETGEPIEEILYYREVQFPLTFNFEDFDYIAVLESEVPADHIFGDVKPKPEVM